jgi:phosphatidylinositol 3,5-bisphosphate 5-phosphatase
MSEKAEDDAPGPRLPGKKVDSELPPTCPPFNPNEGFEGMDDESPEPKSFERNRSDSAMPRSKKTDYSNEEEEGIRKMHKFTLYETSTRFYLVGADLVNKRYKVLKIDRTAPPGELNLSEDETVYSLNDTLDDGNRGTGGMKLKCSTWGILGFIRFTEAYYMVLITKRKHVAMLGGHYIYQVDATQLIPLTTGPHSKFQQSRNSDEARYLTIFGTLDLSRSFYFSYSYNVTRTLQHNIIRAKTDPSYGRSFTGKDLKNMFIWNHHLLNPAIKALKSPYEWIHPIIHGFVDQRCASVLLNVT